MKNTKLSILNSQFLILFVVALVLASCSSKSDGPARRITLKGVTLVYIPAGSFTMGSSSFTDPWRNLNEEPHPVTLTEGFYLSECAITNAQYCAFLNNREIKSPATMTYDGSVQTLITPHAWGCTFTGGQWQPSGSYSDYPVICVSWYGAGEYCKWAEGRLPTEAEWEYACRAGTTGPFNTGPKLTTDQANYNGRIPYNEPENPFGIWLGHTVRVKSYAPNAWGLYQMHGNVNEWCSDWYDDYIIPAPPNPKGPSSGFGHVFRGSCWEWNAFSCRSAFRNTDGPSDYRILNVGFRLACSL